MLSYLFRYVETYINLYVFDLKKKFIFSNLRGRHSQVGSLAGAAHLLNNNTGVLRQAQWEQKSHVD
jgi:hypothetical protein